MHPGVALLLTLLAEPARGAAAEAAGFWRAFAARVGGGAWPPPPAHVPSFFATAENVSMAGSRGPYVLRVWAVRDAAAGGGVVAAYVPAASEDVEGWKNGATPELNLLVPLPALAPAQLPPLPRYGWAWLYGAKLVTIPWLDCCNVTGDVAGFSFSADYSETWTLTQFQSWAPNGSHPGRSATSDHEFTLRYDANVGYVIDVRASMIINAAAAPRTLEFVNFLTPQLANPWPQRAPHPVLPGARSTVTAWTADADGASWSGFAENLLAGAMLGQYNVSASSGVGAVVMAAAGSWSVALAFAGPYVFAQATCPTWMDQHQIVHLPPPGPDGFVVAVPTFSLGYLPASASDFVVANARLVSHVGDGTRGNGSGVILRLDMLEDLGDQPMPLTEPLRGLVQAAYQRDYDVVAAPGGAGGRALAVPALTPSAAQALYAFANALPLVPLNASTEYAVRAGAALAPACAGAVARLVVSLYEDDDFNSPFANHVLITSANATGENWQALALTFTSPAWPMYLDARFEALAESDDSPCNESAYFANLFIGHAATLARLLS